MLTGQADITMEFCPFIALKISCSQCLECISALPRPKGDPLD